MPSRSVKRVVERPQIGRQFFVEVAGKEAQGFTGFDGGARQHDALHLAAFQCLDRLGDGEIGLAGAGGAKRQHHALCVYRVHQLLLGRA